MRAWRGAGRFWCLLAFFAIGLLAPIASAAAAPVPLPGRAAYPPIGVPVNTLVQLNATGLRAIVIGSSYYDTDYVVDEVVLRRSDLSEVANYLWDGPHAATGALNDIAHRSDADFVVVAAGPSPVAGGDWSKVFEALGATPVGNVSDGNWSVIGVPGASSGGWSNSQGAIEGYFQHDRTGPYVFEPKERIGVDLDAPGAPAGQNIMRVGSSTYPSGPLVGTGKVTRGCATAGFQVVVLDAVTLKMRRPGSKTFATNGCGFFSDSAGEDDLAIYLAQLARSSSRLLVLVQSIGRPLMDPSTLPGLWGLVDQEMAAVGGTPTVLETDTGSYSLIGSVGIPSFPLAESSQSALAAMSNNPNPPAAHETAVLKRNASYAFEPQLSSPDGKFHFGFVTTVYQPSQSFGDTAGEQRALAYISMHVLHLPWPVTAKRDFCYDPPMPDVRYAYCYGLALRHSWPGFARLLRATPYPASSSPDFSVQDWSQVITQLAGTGNGTYGEFYAVAVVKSIFQEIMSGKKSNVPATLAVAEKEATQIQSALAGDAQQDASGLWIDLVGNMLNESGAAFADTDAAGTINLLAGVLYLAEDAAAAGGSGGPLGSFSVQAGNFEEALATAYSNATDNLMHLSDVVMTDPGKLRAFYDNQQSFDYVETPSVDAAARLGAAQFTYQSLLPAAYELVRLERSNNFGLMDARQYQCGYLIDDLPGNYYPFEDEPLSGQLLNSALYALVERGTALPNGDGEIYPPTPPSSLTDPLFEPYPYASTNKVIDQVGLFKPWFYREAYNPGAGGQLAVTAC